MAAQQLKRVILTASVDAFSSNNPSPSASSDHTKDMCRASEPSGAAKTSISIDEVEEQRDLSKGACIAPVFFNALGKLRVKVVLFPA